MIISRMTRKKNHGYAIKMSQTVPEIKANGFSIIAVGMRLNKVLLCESGAETISTNIPNIEYSRFVMPPITTI